MTFTLSLAAFQLVIKPLGKRPKYGIRPSRHMPIGMHPTFRLLSFKLFSLRF